MKVALGVAAVIGFILIALGYRAMNEPGESADVRAGGAVPVVLGMIILVADLVVAFIYAVVK